MDSDRKAPTPPAIALGRVRAWIYVSTAVAIPLVVELFGTRLGRRPLDAVRMAAMFGLVLGAAALHWLTIRRLLTRTINEFQGFLEADLKQSKDTFISNVSHGLRSPLTGIVGFAYLLGDMPIGSEQKEAANMIISESAELSRMVDDLVTAAQLDAGDLSIMIQPVSMLTAAEKVCDFMNLLGAEVGLDLQDLDVMVDPERFTQVLRNLVTNAHRHGKPTITIRGNVAKGRYVCHVVDQGPGVAIGDRSRLFNRFSTSVFGGQFTGSVGLGLAVVAELTVRMGCEISYRRIRGETQFVLSIPLADTQAAETKRIVRTSSPRSQERPALRVLSA